MRNFWIKPCILAVVLMLLSTGCTQHLAQRRQSQVLGERLGTAAPASFEKGCAALVSRQHADDGSWGGDDVTVESSHKSDYPVAISSLAYLALMTVAPNDQEALRARQASLSFILDTIEDGNMKNTRDNTPKVHERNVWSQGFSLFVLSRVLDSDDVAEASKATIRARIAEMVAALAKTQQKDGGWTYDKGVSESFLTSTLLIGLQATRTAGIPVPDALIDGPRQFISGQSNPGNYVAYQGLPKKLDESGKVRDSIGRSVQLELALIETGAGSIERLTQAIDTYFQFRDRVDRVRDLEKGCHQRPYMIGTFYCFFGYFYLAQALEVVGGETRDKYLPVLREHFLGLQKADGHWIDSRDHCGESYGTAMGLLILSAPLWAGHAGG